MHMKTRTITIAFLLLIVFCAGALAKNKVDDRLPVPVLTEGPKFTDLYWKSWELAKGKVRSPRPGSGFVSVYMDEGFSENIFQWDSCFMVMFGRYAQDVVPGVKSFDNFYAKQHPDGFIDREIRETDGTDYWGPKHNNAINPPLYSWVEWETYLITGDASRFTTVYPHLKNYYEWIKAHRLLPTGLYWTTNLASGMDNSPRIFAKGDDSGLSYGYSWVDLTSQQALNALCLSRIAELIGNKADADYFKNEYDVLARLVNDFFWDEKSGMYYDLDENGKLTRVKTVASFWPLLAKIAPPDRAKRLIEKHLMNKKEFWRPHPFPTTAASNIYYQREGGYWRGSVWAPTEYMIVRGLENYGYEDFAREAVEKHLENMLKVYQITGTIWENYAPEYPSRGSASAADFVGWSGVGPVAMLIENIIGLRADAPADRLRWLLSRTDKHGINNFHFGDNPKVSLIAEKRNAKTDPVVIAVETNTPFELAVESGAGNKTVTVPAGKTEVRIP